MRTARKYLYIAVVIRAVRRAGTIYHNFQGVRCLSDLAQIDRFLSFVPGQLEEIERNSSIITNSYFCSGYGIVLIVIGFVKKGKDNDS